jgi:sulfofructose kinase
VMVSFDGGAFRYRPEFRKLVPLTDVCIVALDFARKYTGNDEINQSAAVLLDEGPSLVVITEGVQGSWIYSKDGTSFHQPAFLLDKTIDTTGCGDSYHGAFLYGLLRKMGLRETARMASAVAALNSLKPGGRLGLPTLDIVYDFLNHNSENTQTKSV